MEIKPVNAIITITVAVICIAAILVPVVNDAQKTAGDTVTYTNTSGLSEMYVSNDVSETHTFNVTAPNTYVTVDGADINISDATKGFYFISDAVSVYYSGAFITISYEEDTSYQYYPAGTTSYDITYADGTVTLIKTVGGTATTYTDTYTWFGERVDEGDGNYINKISGSTAYYNSIKDFIGMGYYNTGENDTAYVLKDGTLSLKQDYDGSTSTISSALVSGTTDVYSGKPQISVGDETFTPFSWLVKKEIDGHATSGGYYSLLGAIPIMFIVGLLVLTIGTMNIGRND